MKEGANENIPIEKLNQETNGILPIAKLKQRKQRKFVRLMKSEERIKKIKKFLRCFTS